MEPVNGGQDRPLRRFLVDQPRHALDLWRIPNLALWAVLFAVGLFPEWVYEHVRELGLVAVQRAMVNSAWIITFACSGYLGWFTLARLP